MGARALLGHCAAIALVALICDTLGLLFLLLAPLTSWDFFVYGGALLLAFSLLFWVLWYTFSIEEPLG